jgi:CRISPR-associated protein Csd2
VFSHENKLGNAPAHKLFDRIQIPSLQDKGIVPRQFSDYEVMVNDTDLPTGVTLTRLIEG